MASILVALSFGIVSTVNSQTSNSQTSPDTPQPPAQTTPSGNIADERPLPPLPKINLPAESAPKAKSAGLVVASQGGAYQQSQGLAYFDAFQRETGIPIKALSHGGAVGQLRGQIDPSWDVVDLPRDQAAIACAQGQLEKLDADSVLGPNARQDFLGGTVDECGLPSTAWSAVFLYDTRVFEKRLPTSAQDVFNISRFPGKRALPKSPRYVLEAALRADGVSAADIYKTLETPEGLTRAFSKLDRIKSQIVWWDKPEDATAFLAKKQAAFALSFSGRAFFSMVRDRQPFAVIWNGQILDLNVWGIAKTSQNQGQAKEFLKFVLDPRRLAQQTRWFPYGPARVSSVAFVGKHADINMDMTPYLPTAPANMKDTIMFDGAFWVKNDAALSQRFTDWIAAKVDAGGNPISSPR